MKMVSTSLFNREYIGGKEIKEPMILTYKETPVCYIYPMDSTVVDAFIQDDGDGNVTHTTVHKAESDEKSQVIGGPESSTGQCQVCYAHGTITKGYTIVNNGRALRWMCEDCFSRGEETSAGFGPKDMMASKKSHSFRG